MEPRLPTPAPSPEMGGYRPVEAPKPLEQGQAAHMPEFQQNKGEQHEVGPQAPVAGPVTGAPVVHKPQLPAPAASPAEPPVQAQPLTDDNPLTANDDDLIEKEWVAKAKKIVQDTKADPYKQESEVSKLQADYLKKRYGKDIKLNSN